MKINNTIALALTIGLVCSFTTACSKSDAEPASTEYNTDDAVTNQAATEELVAEEEILEAPQTTTPADAATEAKPDHDTEHDSDHVDQTDEHDHEETSVKTSDDNDAHDHDEHSKEGSLTAHVHGQGQLVVVRSETGYLANFIAPLASLGLDPSETDSDSLPDSITKNWLIGDAEAKCEAETKQSFIAIQRLGDHGEIDLDYTFTCQDPSKLKTVRLAFFENISALETVSATFMHAGNQTTQSLSQKNPTVILH